MKTILVTTILRQVAAAVARISLRRGSVGCTLLLLATSSPLLRAATPEIVGTWKYSETVQLEFRPDGAILSNSRHTGTWSRRDKITEYLIVLSDGSSHIATLGKYKRHLTAESRARGVKKSMARVDGGPTANPDVPDERTALNMESADLEKNIEEALAGAATARREASEFWQKHHAARAIGRISSWNLEAERAGARARALELTASNSHARLVELKSQLAMK